MEHPLFRARWGTRLTKINHSIAPLFYRDLHLGESKLKSEMQNSHQKL